MTCENFDVKSFYCLSWKMKTWSRTMWLIWSLESIVIRTPLGIRWSGGLLNRAEVIGKENGVGIILLLNLNLQSWDKVSSKFWWAHKEIGHLTALKKALITGGSKKQPKSPWTKDRDSLVNTQKEINESTYACNVGVKYKWKVKLIKSIGIICRELINKYFIHNSDSKKFMFSFFLLII